jgi:hypothetical protein
MAARVTRFSSRLGGKRPAGITYWVSSAFDSATLVFLIIPATPTFGDDVRQIASYSSRTIVTAHRLAEMIIDLENYLGVARVFIP